MLFIFDSFLLLLISFLLSLSSVLILVLSAKFGKKGEEYHIGIHEILRKQK